MARVLIVDDEPKMRELLSEALQSYGHEVISASTGMEAMGLLLSRSFDLALLDIVLPHIDGLGLLEIIKNQHPQTMVILISGQGDLDSAIKALSKGAFDYLKKPFNFRNLEGIVSRALEESRLMKTTGFIYKDSKRDNKALLKKGPLLAAFESLLVGLAFFVSFAFQADILSSVSPTYIFGPLESLLMSFGIAFCYAFIFVYRRSFRTDMLDSKTEVAAHLLWNIACAYILDITILALVKGANFPISRMAIGFGFILGYLGLLAGRFIVLPRVITKASREGRKRITFVGEAQQPKPAAVEQGNQLLKPTGKTVGSAKDRSLDRFEELHIQSDSITPENVIGLINGHRSKNLKIVVHESPDTFKMP
jgi:CheY-like chemotaxis protein